MTRLSLSLLGAFQAELAGAPLSRFATDKVRALLAYLAVESERPHRRESLAGLLWPEYSERKARQSLSQALSNLRRILEDQDEASSERPPFLLTTHQTVQFNPASDHWVDVKVLLERLTACERHQHRRLEACHACLAQYQEAAALYQGPFLDGFSLPDSASFEEWLRLERERLQRLVSEALACLARGYEAQGIYDEACQYAWREVELDPLHEEAHHSLMRLLVLSGQRSAALAQYEKCRRLLADELGGAPGTEIRELYEQIRAGEAIVSPRSAVALIAHNLPAQLTPFVGRERALAELTQMLVASDQRLVTILGAGGVGKTRLALEAAATLVSGRPSERFPDGLYFVSLAPLDSPEGIAATVAKALNFSFYPGGDPEQQLLDYLRQKRLLLVLDNFEHLLEGSDLVVTMLEVAPDLKILTTSRARLNVPGEQLFQIAGIDFPEVDVSYSQAAAPGQRRPEPDQSLPAVSRYGAVKLFLQSARRTRADFSLTADNIRAVIRICRLVEGFPLALIMAAAWVELLPPDEIAAEIAQTLDFLATDWQAMPERQRSMRAVCDHSWRLLAEPERHLFQALSVFRGGFSREAAQAVTEATLPALMRLANKSFLHRSATDRYQVHQLLRQYGAEKLAQAPQTEALVRRQHGAYYAAFLQQREAALKGPDQQQALAEIEAESENIQGAWHWAIGQRQLEPLAQMVDGLGRFCDWRGDYQMGERACQAAMAQALATAPSGAGCRLAAKVLAWQGLFNFRMGKVDQATDLVRQSLSLLADPALADQDTRPERAFALQQMVEIIHESDPELSQRLGRQSLALYQACGDCWERANVLHLLARVAGNVADCGQAKQQLAECLAIRRALGDQRGIADTLSQLGLTAVYQGEFEEAERLLQESITLGQGMGDRVNSAERLVRLGLAFLHNGQFVKAQTLFEACLATWRDLGVHRRLINEHMRLGETKMNLGRYTEAEAQLELALNLAREANYQAGVMFTLFFLSWVALVKEKYDEARQLARESIALARLSHRSDELAGALAILGWAAYKLGDRPGARRAFCEAVQITAEKRILRALLVILPLYALYLAEEGQGAWRAKERAVELYALASSYGVVANSRWFDDVVGRPIAAVAATLPPETVSAAQERGKAWDVWATVAELLAELDVIS